MKIKKVLTGVLCFAMILGLLVQIPVKAGGAPSGKEQVTVSLIMKSWEYGDDPFEPEFSSGNRGDGIPTYEYRSRANYTSPYTPFDISSGLYPTLIGDYTLRVSFPATENYAAKTLTADFSITKKTMPKPKLKWDWDKEKEDGYKGYIEATDDDAYYADMEKMEYSHDARVFYPFDVSQVTADKTRVYVEQGTYFVRYRETLTTKASEWEIATVYNGTGGNNEKDTNPVVTVSNSTSVKVNCAVSNGTASVGGIEEAVLDKIVRGNGNAAITVDCSGIKDDIHTLVFDRYSLEAILKLMCEKTAVTTLRLNYKQGALTLDALKLEGVLSTADEMTVGFSLKKAVCPTLASSGRKVLEAYEVEISKLLGSFWNIRSGNFCMEVKIPATVNAADYELAYVNSAGVVEGISASCNGGTFTGVVKKAGVYAVLTKGEEKPEPKPQVEIETSLALDEGLEVAQRNKVLCVDWGYVPEADGYEVFVTIAGKTFDFNKPEKVLQNKEITSVTMDSLSGKSLQIKKAYQVCIVAFKVEDGKRISLYRSMTAYVAGSANKKYTNATDVKLAKRSFNLKTGDRKTVKATIIKANTKKKLLAGYCKKFRYKTSNPAVATVSGGGEVIARGSGRCYIYVFAKNGFARKIKVTVE